MQFLQQLGLNYQQQMAQLLLQIIERAKTYQLLKWHYRNPFDLSPYKLSSKGYQCTQLNTVQCHTCHNKVCMTNQQGIQKSYQQITKQLQNHNIACCYKDEEYKRYSRAELYLRMDQLIQSVKESYKNQGNNQNSNNGEKSEKVFPLLNMKRFRDEVMGTNQFQMLNSIMVKYKMDPKDSVRISFVLTVMGWQRKSCDTLQCAFCGRFINIKQYKFTNQDKQKYHDSQSQQKQELFDAFGQHRYFCLWVYDETGWQIYIQYLYDKLGQAEQLFKNQDPQSIQKIRTLIDVYLQKFKNIIGQNFEKASKILTQCSQMVNSIQQNQEQTKKVEQEVTKRKRQMSKFLQDIQEQVRVPLKRIKID